MLLGFFDHLPPVPHPTLFCPVAAQKQKRCVAVFINAPRGFLWGVSSIVGCSSHRRRRMPSSTEAQGVLLLCVVLVRALIGGLSVGGAFAAVDREGRPGVFGCSAFSGFVAVAAPATGRAPNPSLRRSPPGRPCRAAGRGLVLQCGLKPPDDCFLAPVVPVQPAEMLTYSICRSPCARSAWFALSPAAFVHITFGRPQHFSCTLMNNSLGMIASWSSSI